MTSGVSFVEMAKASTAKWVRRRKECVARMERPASASKSSFGLSGTKSSIRKAPTRQRRRPLSSTVRGPPKLNRRGMRSMAIDRALDAELRRRMTEAKKRLGLK